MQPGTCPRAYGTVVGDDHSRGQLGQLFHPNEGIKVKKLRAVGVFEHR